MSGFVGVGGAHKELTAMSVGVSSVWKSVQEGYVGVGGAWKLFFSAFSATVAPGAASVADSGPGTFTTNTVTVTADGVGPFTYAWSRSSGDARITATAGSSATTAFSATIGVELATATFQCVVTDTSSGDVIILSVDVTIDGTAV